VGIKVVFCLLPGRLGLPSIEVARGMDKGDAATELLRYELYAGMSTLTLVCVCCLIGVMIVSVGIAIYCAL
jgi:hypothetical protein